MIICTRDSAHRMLAQRHQMNVKECRGVIKLIDADFGPAQTSLKQQY